VTCNRSVGLVARVIEDSGISTVAVSIIRKLTEEAGVPRAVFLHWPLGHPLGEPFNSLQQRIVLIRALKRLTLADKPGIIEDLPFRWRRHEDLKE